MVSERNPPRLRCSNTQGCFAILAASRESEECQMRKRHLKQNIYPASLDDSAQEFNCSLKWLQCHRGSVQACIWSSPCCHSNQCRSYNFYSKFVLGCASTGVGLSFFFSFFVGNKKGGWADSLLLQSPLCLFFAQLLKVPDISLCEICQLKGDINPHSVLCSHGDRPTGSGRKRLHCPDLVTVSGLQVSAVSVANRAMATLAPRRRSAHTCAASS